MNGELGGAGREWIERLSKAAASCAVGNLHDDLIWTHPTQLFAHRTLASARVAVECVERRFELLDFAGQTTILFALRVKLRLQSSISRQPFVPKHHHGNTYDREHQNRRRDRQRDPFAYR
jgi:hypothetical protein